MRDAEKQHTDRAGVSTPDITWAAHANRCRGEFTSFRELDALQNPNKIWLGFLCNKDC